MKRFADIRRPRAILGLLERGQIVGVLLAIERLHEIGQPGMDARLLGRGRGQPAGLRQDLIGDGTGEPLLLARDHRAAQRIAPRQIAGPKRGPAGPEMFEIISNSPIEPGRVLQAAPIGETLAGARG